MIVNRVQRLKRMGGNLPATHVASAKAARIVPMVTSTALVAILAMAIPAFAWEGKCVGVADGDTITVLHNGTGERIRLYGIDTPEKRQDFGTRAKQFTSSLVFGKVVRIEPYDTDRYGRTVAMVYAGDRCVNEELIRSGLAWVYTQYCKAGFCDGWKQLEESARASNLGLWALLGSSGAIRAVQGLQAGRLRLLPVSTAATQSLVCSIGQAAGITTARIVRWYFRVGRRLSRRDFGRVRCVGLKSKTYTLFNLVSIEPPPSELNYQEHKIWIMTK